ncbi:hypothetical protein ACPCSD_33935 [Streptomyces griseoincarnatus]
MTTVTETRTAVAAADKTSADPVAAGRQALIERWAARHGVDAARRLAETEDLEHFEPGQERAPWM